MGWTARLYGQMGRNRVPVTLDTRRRLSQAVTKQVVAICTSIPVLLACSGSDVHLAELYLIKLKSFLSLICEV